MTTQGSGISSTPQTVVDAAGNTSVPSNVVAVAIDETPPTLNGTATAPPNADGWYTSDVTIAWNCADVLSGVSGSCPTNSSITGEGFGLSAGASIADLAGNSTLASMTSSIQEAKARDGFVVALVTEGDTATAGLADVHIPIPRAPYWLQPFLAAIPLQLLAYHMAVLSGADVDQPRNLAKSVTVE